MRYSVLRPDKPVVWLDTHAITDMALALERPTTENGLLKDVYEKLIQLRRAGRIVCFESDQLTEIEVRPELVERSSKVLTHITQGLSSHYQFPMKLQDQISMKAALEDTEHAEIEFRTAFNMLDPSEDRSVGGFIVRARFQRSAQEISRMKTDNRSIADVWESMRLKNRSTGMKLGELVKLHTAREALAGQDIFLNNYRKALKQRVNGEQPSVEDIFSQMEFVGTPAVTWHKYGGRNSAREIAEYYGSEYYTTLPYNDIRAKLTAYKISGNEAIKPSDVMDIQNISSFLPYCTIMVLDRAMIHAVKWLGLDGKYQTKVIPLSQLERELPI